MTAYIADLSERGKGNGFLENLPCRTRKGDGLAWAYLPAQALFSGSTTVGRGGAVMLLMIFSSVFEKPLTIDMITAAR